MTSFNFNFNFGPVTIGSMSSTGSEHSTGSSTPVSTLSVPSVQSVPVSPVKPVSSTSTGPSTSQGPSIFDALGKSLGLPTGLGQVVDLLNTLNGSTSSSGSCPVTGSSSGSCPVAGSSTPFRGDSISELTKLLGLVPTSASNSSESLGNVLEELGSLIGSLSGSTAQFGPVSVKVTTSSSTPSGPKESSGSSESQNEAAPTVPTVQKKELTIAQQLLRRMASLPESGLVSVDPSIHPLIHTLVSAIFGSPRGMLEMGEEIFTVFLLKVVEESLAGLRGKGMFDDIVVMCNEFNKINEAIGDPLLKKCFAKHFDIWNIIHTELNAFVNELTPEAAIKVDRAVQKGIYCMMTMILTDMPFSWKKIFSLIVASIDNVHLYQVHDAVSKLFELDWVEPFVEHMVMADGSNMETLNKIFSPLSARLAPSEASSSEASSSEASSSEVSSSEASSSAPVEDQCECPGCSGVLDFLVRIGLPKGSESDNSESDSDSSETDSDSDSDPKSEDILNDALAEIRKQYKSDGSTDTDSDSDGSDGSSNSSGSDKGTGGSQKSIQVNLMDIVNLISSASGAPVPDGLNELLSAISSSGMPSGSSSS